MLTITDVVTDAVLDAAYAWLCTRRQDWPASADVWRFRQGWAAEKTRLRSALLAGTYEVGLLSRVTLRNGEEVDLWPAADAVVMKALALVLPPHLPLAPQCTHLKGHGGLKGAVRQVLAHLPRYRFVLKTDVHSYYASIEHQVLLDKLAPHLPDPRVLRLIAQYLQRCAERGGLYWEATQGLALGSPLSPIMGAFFLAELDGALASLGLFYVRYMDDILVLAPTRWTLRKAVKVVNQVFATLHIRKHPEKTFIGRVEKGFDFLGYHFCPGRLTVAAKTLEHFVARVRQLYEQEPGAGCCSRLGVYVQRWVRWVRAGVTMPRPDEYGCSQPTSALFKLKVGRVIAANA